MLTRRFSCVLAVTCVVCAALSFAGAAPESPAPEPADVPALIRQLGDTDFRAREAATRRLREVGKPAMPLLREALTGGDPEVCSRADSLLRQIERPRIPAGWFRDFTDWKRSETAGNGRVVVVVQRDRRVEVRERPGSLEMTIDGLDGGENVHIVFRARDAADLRRQDPDAADVYERVAGTGANVNFRLRNRRLMVPPMPIPMPLPQPGAVPRLMPMQRPPAARLLPLAPGVGLPRPPVDDLVQLERRLLREMRGAEVPEAEQQAVLEAIRMLREIQAQGRMVAPDDLAAQIRKYNALSDAVRQKLEDLKLPGPGDALPPPARARLGVSVAAPDVEDDPGGVRVTLVVPDSRGEKIGLKAGDVIHRINTRRVYDPAFLRHVLTETKEPLVIDVVRDGAPTVLQEKAR